MADLFYMALFAWIAVNVMVLASPLLGRLTAGIIERGFSEAREWLALASTRQELERLCRESRANRKAA